MSSSDWLYDLFIEEAIPALDRHSGGSGDGTVTAHSKIVTPTKSQQNVYPDSGYDYLSKVVVKPIPDSYLDALAFYDKTVEASAFESDSTYSDYPYRAIISLSGVTTAYTPYVMFSEGDATLGILSRDANSYDGGIYIYSKEVPSSSISITEIICIKE